MPRGGRVLQPKQTGLRTVQRFIADFRRLPYEERTMAVEEMREFIDGFQQGRAEVWIEGAAMLKPKTRTVN